jgi:transcription elongation factor Elf1
MTNNGDKKTCATCGRLDGSICKLDGFCIGNIETGTCEKYKQRPSSAGSENTGARQAVADKERREIAGRLRQRRKEMDNEKPPQGYLFAAAVYLLEISRAVKCGESGALFYRLADLIDRETCTLDGTPDRIGYVCSNCGQTFTRRPFMKRVFGADTEVEIPYRFCPYCGAEVVADDE